jgi:DNA modification methylase
MRPGARMVVWCTFPLLAQWMAADLGRWRYVTGGAWCKTGGIGQGYHWRGDAEVALVYVDRRAPAGRPHATIRSGHTSKRGKHSAKPIAWQRSMIRAWSRPGDLVIDPFAGLGSVGVAASIEARRYLGWELDPARHAVAQAEIDRVLGRGLWEVA